ncbi:hypothetical protein LP420_09455 [Massilia sp. B-10]|nr:hypothetical protein LP420_09455 [Massilia sp. B-10]
MRPEPRERPGARDPMGIGPRISIFDADGEPLFGPPDVPRTIERAVLVDGKLVASIRLRPLVQVGMAPTLRPSLFLREQVRDIVLVACAMALVSILLAVWLARHLLRPVAALRDVAGAPGAGPVRCARRCSRATNWPNWPCTSIPWPRHSKRANATGARCWPTWRTNCARR